MRKKTFWLFQFTLRQKADPVSWGCEQSHACLLSKDEEEKMWFTLDQLAWDRFNAILQGIGHLRGPNCGLSQKVFILVIKKTGGRVKTLQVERLWV